jgi:hypothetical protein
MDKILKITVGRVHRNQRGRGYVLQMVELAESKAQIVMKDKMCETGSLEVCGGTFTCCQCHLCALLNTRTLNLFKYLSILY